MNKRVVKKLAIFDFDGTLTTRDTTLLFVFYVTGKIKGTWIFVTNIIQLSLAILEMQDWVSVKEKIFKQAFTNRTALEIEAKGNEFGKKIVPKILNDNVYKEMKQLQRGGYEIVLLSASCRVWLQQWCKDEGIELVCTELIVESDRYTGKISGKNCYGKQKVDALQSVYYLQSTVSIIAYGNHKSDLYYMRLAQQAFMVDGKKIERI